MRFAAVTILSAAALASAETINGLVSKRTFGSQFCASISGHLDIGAFLPGGKSFSVGIFEDICICEGDISVFVSSNSVCKSGTKIIGQAKITSAITAMLHGCGNKKQCSYPDYATPVCSKNNVCDFNCPSGFQKGTKNGKPACVCPSGTSICGGQCKASCASARSLPEKRDLVYWGKQTQRSCKSGWQACGVPGGGPRDWECVDTQNDLESCGGCPIDVMSSLTGVQGLGVDCTTIPGVADVSCIAGRCAVAKCERGFKVSRSGQHCEEIETHDKSALSNAIHFVETAYSISK